ncbi:c-type cytochrome biogenesis protein CcmI [Paraferrimonas sp. SM1919]|uniref:c-type cytochrome biogenesis protein CcmI n=1 Tax=Paraferrimonas sp. SM1919 TaxID=2662263 RepID=UPI0013D6BA76|nr:c-type cytochrome biogenesis protein CcmI [Paraferrimonas sp. SM1919]
MLTLWILIAFILLLGLLLIWVPHLRQRTMLEQEQQGVRKQANIALYKEKVAAAERELESEEITEAQFEQLKQELKLTLLQDLDGETDQSLSEIAEAKGLMTPVILSAILISCSLGFYLYQGQYQQSERLMHQAKMASMPPAERLQAEIKLMEQELQGAPESANLWYNLGHAYLNAQRFQDAVSAFDKTISLQGQVAEVLGAKATALYQLNGQMITEEVKPVIEQALAIDPKEVSTLLLIAMDAFQRGEYQIAIIAWQTILELKREDIDNDAIEFAISRAKQALEPKSPLGVTVNLSIAPELLAQVSPDDAIFLFARNSGAGGPPAAAMKLTVSQLPITVKLDDNYAMMEQNKISMLKLADINATLSKSGDVRALSGDMTGSIAAVEISETATVNLVIDKVVD